MKTAFAGFPSEGIEFMRKLERNNRREWFQPRKEEFEEKVKEPMRELVTCLNSGLAKFAPEYITDPEKAIFRIYRDTRFSKDKTPYKTHIAAQFRRGTGCVQNEGGYYVGISHKEVAIGGGIYAPEPSELLALRNRIASHHEELNKILANRTLRKLCGGLHGDQLTRVPKGFSPDHPAADLLRHKRLVFYIELAPDLATKPTLLKEILTRFEAMVPLLHFVQSSFGPKKPKLDPRDFM